ncbi:hypothetical protein EGR_03148 [Echinococcus granulosus]|uniref:Uncharacterized protein n=1 Tax=Echinococcus granulosus TaxID=6210 RepID=W6UJZ7_ECHGR|nr:hypothetical protein EGR_03148 [Echinococcus granulosus]EUB61875.1 hypothetical protein EGR_03148 [Echinococcus granulosus]
MQLVGIFILQRTFLWQVEVIFLKAWFCRFVCKLAQRFCFYSTSFISLHSYMLINNLDTHSMGLDGFFVTEQIASGLCSHVLRAVRKRDGLSVVLKCYDAENAVPGMFVQTQSGGDEPILREAYFLQKVQGVNGCVKMVDYFFDESRNQFYIKLMKMKYAILNLESLNLSHHNGAYFSCQSI